jgi:hypothetical protein
MVGRQIGVLRMSNMPIVDLFSSRQALSQKADDVWVYNQIPEVLRVQVSNIVGGALGAVREHGPSSAVYAPNLAATKIRLLYEAFKATEK